MRAALAGQCKAVFRPECAALRVAEVNGEARLTESHGGKVRETLLNDRAARAAALKRRLHHEKAEKCDAALRIVEDQIHDGGQTVSRKEAEIELVGGLLSGRKRGQILENALLCDERLVIFIKKRIAAGKRIMRRDVRARERPDFVMAREHGRGEPLRVAAGEPCLADQSLENQRFALQYDRIGWAMRVAAVYRDGVERFDPFQREAFVRLVGIQPLANRIVRETSAGD